MAPIIGGFHLGNAVDAHGIHDPLNDHQVNGVLIGAGGWYAQHIGIIGDRRRVALPPLAINGSEAV